ncbi:hypothetical protein JNB88_18040 [Rhizobium cauense]|uniref:hypothetical protein n=1 Tax=Rhizobium cauense TaxID=1166683 RepID=UPI001C6E698F|nr:hypothetical protein [Rhizobium cauense]MBW9115542.1 hypothetical protein [Rhizobium cauense]
MLDDSSQSTRRLKAADRDTLIDRTDRAAKETTELERRHREAKTERLRLARLQAEEQERQL